MYTIKAIQRGRRPSTSKIEWIRRMPSLRYPSIPEIGGIRFYPTQYVTVSNTFLVQHRAMLEALLASGIVSVCQGMKALKISEYDALVTELKSTPPEVVAPESDKAPEVSPPPVEVPDPDETEVEEEAEVENEEEVENEAEVEVEVDEEVPEEPEDEDEPERARNEDGEFVADNPETPEVNEAWVGGKSPKQQEVEEPASLVGPISLYSKMNKTNLLNTLKPFDPDVSETLTKKELLGRIKKLLK